MLSTQQLVNIKCKPKLITVFKIFVILEKSKIFYKIIWKILKYMKFISQFWCMLYANKGFTCYQIKRIIFCSAESLEHHSGFNKPFRSLIIQSFRKDSE